MPLHRRRINGHEKKIVGARQAWRCQLCDSLLDETFEVDHVVPLHLGGVDDISNCRALCPNCHRKVTVHQEAERVRRSREEMEAVLASGSSSTQMTLQCPPTTIPPHSQDVQPPLVSSSLYCPRCRRTVSPYFVHSRTACKRADPGCDDFCNGP